MSPGQTEGAFQFRHVGDDALLLHEFAHRTANQIAAAAAAMHLAKGAVSPTGTKLLEQGAARLEAFGALHKVLARPVRSRANVSEELVATCRAIAAGAPGASRSVVSLDVPNMWMDGTTARRLVLIAAELVENAVHHALEGRAGRLDVSLAQLGEDVVLMVRDDGTGMRAGAATSGTGLGSGIVAELVGRAGGTMSVRSGPAGTSIKVALLLRAGTAEDGCIAF